MPPTFLGINTALRGLEAQQTAIDIAGHNIANSSTPGYSRQTANLQTTDPIQAPTLQSTGAGQLGTGVTVASITRSHDDFIQQQVLHQNSSQTEQQATSDTLSQVSQIFNDPTDQGFSNLLSNFLTSWQQLSGNPSDNPTRAVVLAQGNALANGFNGAAKSLQQMQNDQDSQVGKFVTQINTISKQIADLNQQITSVGAASQQPNDLMDPRDSLLGQLSQLVSIQYSTQSNGTINVSLNGAGALVQGAASFQLGTAPDASNPQFTAVTLSGQSGQVAVQGGQLGAAITNRDVTIGQRITALDSLASSVANGVNQLQSTGYGSNGSTGINFFNGSTAAGLTVSNQISSNLANIAAAGAANQPGDGSQALKIAQLQENPPTGGTVTLQAQYQGIISQLGVDGNQAQTNAQTGSLILQHLNDQANSVSGVSLNEEAANLMQYQRAYEAAGRVISIMDQLISGMIQQLGGG